MDAERLASYLASLEPEEDALLARLEEEAQAEGVPIIRRETQRLLRFLVRYTRAERILEIGAAVGYSALLMWRASEGQARITTIENYEKRLARARENIAAAGAEEKIELLAGDAAQLLPTLTGTYGMVFQDAAKGQYLSFLPEVTRLLAPGGLLVTDNIWQGGDVIESRYAVRRRDRTIHERMREYLYTITHSADYDTLLLDVGDGVALSARR